MRMTNMDKLTRAVILIFVHTYLLSCKVSMDKYSSYYTNDTGDYSAGSVRATFLGTTTLLLDDGNTQLLFDAFVSRPSLFRVALSKISTDSTLVTNVLHQNGMNRIKAVFVSHSHYDHTLDLPFIADKTHAVVYGSVSTLNICRGGGVKNEQLALIEPGKEVQIGKFTVAILDSKHSPATAVNDDLGEVIKRPLNQPNRAGKFVEGGSFDFLVKYNDHTIYIKPSANYIEGKLKDFNADVLFMGVGRLGNQKSSFMKSYYAETAGALNPKLIIPVHWDNFFKPLSSNLKPMSKVNNAFDFIIAKSLTDSIDFRILQGGKSIILFTNQQ
jgi:L-ascorbate metabolism protein UlaG (beta-lactamase superfamily)